MRREAAYGANVFINCPFDRTYQPLLRAILFTVFDCGFLPRCALEESNAANLRLEKIKRLIAESCYGIHDISCTEPDPRTHLPRFNMPLELGLFLGAAQFGPPRQRLKTALILDRHQGRYQKFISDIAGQDIRCHQASAQKLIAHVRDWLNDESQLGALPCGAHIARRYRQFCRALPKFCAEAKLAPEQLTYHDFSSAATHWLRLQSRA